MSHEITTRVKSQLWSCSRWRSMICQPD